MARFTTIQKKVVIPYSLKSCFAPSSHEFGQIDFEKKLAIFRSVVSNGFSVYDLTEEFRKNRLDTYEQDDMKSVLCGHIAELIYDERIHPIVSRFTMTKAMKKLRKNWINL